MATTGYAAAVEAALPAGGSAWRTTEQDGWLQVAPESAVLPDQGWKLHVSGAAPTADAVLAAVLPILVAHRAAFKLAADVRFLEVLNSGAGGFSQIGKLVTIYPADPPQAVALAPLLHAATSALRGPRIPSDRPLVPGSLIYYRYGAFNGDGSTITAPDGTVIFDPRSDRYAPPAWAQDPFLAAGIASDHDPRPRSVYAGRYVVLAPVYRSPANTVIRALDVQARRRCVLKESLPGSWLLEDGRDARDCLRHEHMVLAALAPVADVPAPLDLLELDDGATVLVRELVLGPTLAEAAEALRDRLGTVPLRNLAVWCAQLAKAVLAVHTAGWVLRDLKPQNVVVAADGRLWIIDVGCATRVGAQPSLPGTGTRGYVSPSARERGRAVPADDVFALGAVLLGLATGANPSLAPDADDLLARDPSLLRPDAGPAILELAASCLADEPSGRPELVDVAARLDALASAQRLSRRAPTIGEERHESDALATLGDQGLRDRVADRLVASAEHAPAGPYLDRGRAGLVLALASLLSCGSHRARAALSAQADALASESDQVLTAGLTAGHAGVAVALAQAGAALGRPDLMEAGAALLEREDMPRHRELFLGSAGILRACVIVDELTGANGLGVAKLHGRRLLDELEPIAAGHGWAPDDPVLLGPALGFGHGAAGIADALLDLHALAPDAEILEAAAGVVRMLADEAIPGCVPGSLDWPETVGGERSIPAICHGAAGITRFLAHARRWGVPGAATLLPRAALSTSRGARTLGANVCHGLAGAIEALLDMGEARWRHEAGSLASLLHAFRIESREGLTGFQGDLPGQEDLSFMRGTAGVATTLCRIAGAPPALLPRRRESSQCRG